MASEPFHKLCPLIKSNKCSLILTFIRSFRFSLCSCGLAFEYIQGAQQVA